MTEPELKPKLCPFCGGKARIRKDRLSYYVVCSKCGSRGARSVIKQWHDNKYIAQVNAIKAWNRRINNA